MFKKNMAVIDKKRRTFFCIGLVQIIRMSNSSHLLVVCAESDSTRQVNNQIEPKLHKYSR